MKLIVLLVLFSSPSIWAETEIKNDFPLVLTPQKKAYQPGDKVIVKVKCPTSTGKIVLGIDFKTDKDFITQTSDCAGKTEFTFEIPKKSVGFFPMLVTIFDNGSKPLMSTFKVEVASDASSLESLHLQRPSDEKYEESLQARYGKKGCPLNLFSRNYSSSRFAVYAKYSDGNAASLCENPKMKVSIFKDQKEIEVKRVGEWCSFDLDDKEVGNITVKVSYEDKTRELICPIYRQSTGY